MRFGCNTDEKVQFGKRSPIAFHCIASQRHERPSRGAQSVGTIRRLRSSAFRQHFRIAQRCFRRLRLRSEPQEQRTPPLPLRGQCHNQRLFPLRLR